MCVDPNKGKSTLRPDFASSDSFAAGLDKRTGKNLWNYPTNVKVGISAPGITYTAGGKQYVAVLQGGGGGNSNQQKPVNHGDLVDAFALK